jgi:hypothetical protein
LAAPIRSLQDPDRQLPATPSCGLHIHAAGAGGGLYSAATYELTADNVDRVLDDVRPYLISDSGDIAVVSVEDGVVSLRLEGKVDFRTTGEKKHSSEGVFANCKVNGLGRWGAI